MYYLLYSTNEHIDDIIKTIQYLQSHSGYPQISCILQEVTSALNCIVERIGVENEMMRGKDSQEFFL
ncbi:hypothetical protein SNEBB_003446 [Seison nebaliae]|nr:hypothetical protein SNEBB_003446 [Seison nebaliae]